MLASIYYPSGSSPPACIRRCRYRTCGSSVLDEQWSLAIHRSSMQTSMMTMPPSASLLGLPAELRVEIMEFLCSDGIFSVDIHCKSPDILEKTPRGALALLYTCRLLRIEALPLRPPVHDIEIRLDGLKRASAQLWADCIGIQNLNKIRKLEILVHGSCKATTGTSCPRRLDIVNNRSASTRAYQDIPLRDWMDRNTRTLLSNLSQGYARSNLESFFCCDFRSEACIAATLRELFEPLGELFINGMRKTMNLDAFVRIVEALSTDHTVSPPRA